MTNPVEKSSENEKKNIQENNENVAKEKSELSLSIPSTHSSDTVSESPITSAKESEINPWTYSHYARNYAIGLITVFYALILIVYEIMLLLWQWVNDVSDKEAQDAFVVHHRQYHYYVCVVAYIFFGYCYIVLLLKNQKCKTFFQFLSRKLLFQRGHEEEDIILLDNPTLMPNVGCLYLRLGAVLFAIVTVVFYAFATSLKSGYFQSNILLTIFFIIQTHFVYCSAILFDPKHYIINRFGTMHLFAINVVTAFKFIFAKGQANEVYIGKAFKLNKTSNLYYIPKVVSSLSTTATSIYTTTDSSTEDGSVINRIVRTATYAVEIDDGFGINGSTERALGK
uniref:Uncharacterized protein n=1 Tax=Panagrolaimus davidi TaxID=227884 RepID=A0A914Q2Z8_9BILA